MNMAPESVSQSGSVPDATRRFDNIVTALFLIIGLYLPTSIAGNISQPLTYLAYALVFGLLGLLMLKTRTRLNPLCVILSLIIVPLLLLFSLTSGLPRYTPGALAGYLVLSLMFSSNLYEINCTGGLEPLFTLVNLVNITAGFCIIAGEPHVSDFLIAHYSNAYPELLPNMLSWRKPVLTFATHSLAAFYLYLFFFANLRTFQVKRRRLSFAFALCHLVLIVALLSVSGVLFAALGFVQLFWSLWTRSKSLFVVALILVLLGTPAAFKAVFPHVTDWGAIYDMAKAIVSQPDSGWNGRFGGGGYMQYDLSYVRHNPLTPVGITYRDELMFGDSGVFEYYLRGSVVLLFVIYTGYYCFLRRNLLNRTDKLLLFAVVLAFEMGYCVLLSARTASLLIFLVIYLNSVVKSAPEPHLRASLRSDNIAQELRTNEV